jgi:hypothetical protein
VSGVPLGQRGAGVTTKDDKAQSLAKLLRIVNMYVGKYSPRVIVGYLCEVVE